LANAARKTITTFNSLHSPWIETIWMDCEPHGLTWLPSQFSKICRTSNERANQFNHFHRQFITTFQKPYRTRSIGKLFCRPSNSGLKANLNKCKFGSNNVSYLGYRLTPPGILPGADKLKAEQNSEQPKNVHEVRQFMGLGNFFGSHVNCQININWNKLERWRFARRMSKGIQSTQNGTIFRTSSGLS
jgi:hypothetical protein